MLTFDRSSIVSVLTDAFDRRRRAMLLFVYLAAAGHNRLTSYYVQRCVCVVLCRLTASHSKHMLFQAVKVANGSQSWSVRHSLSSNGHSLSALVVDVVCCRCVPLAGAGEVVVSKRVWSLVSVRVCCVIFCSGLCMVVLLAVLFSVVIVPAFRTFYVQVSDACAGEPVSASVFTSLDDQQQQQSPLPPADGLASPTAASADEFKV